MVSITIIDHSTCTEQSRLWCCLSSCVDSDCQHIDGLQWVKHLLFHAPFWKIYCQNREIRKEGRKWPLRGLGQGCTPVTMWFSSGTLLPSLGLSNHWCQLFSPFLSLSERDNTSIDAVVLRAKKTLRPHVCNFAFTPLPGIPSDLLSPQQPSTVSARGPSRILSLCLWEALHGKERRGEEKEVSVEQRRERGSCPALHKPPLCLWFISH